MLESWCGMEPSIPLREASGASIVVETPPVGSRALVDAAEFIIRIYFH